MQKHETSDTKILKLSINGNDGRIRIGWGVADALHDSSFLSIYLSPEKDAIMVRQCDEKEFLSIKVCKRRENNTKKELRLQSLAFVTSLIEHNSWDKGKTYHMIGKYFEKYNAVVFFFRDATSD